MGRKKLLEKLCTVCKIILPRSEFYERSNGEIFWCCKECSYKITEKWRKANPEKTRIAHRLALIRARENNPELYKSINKNWEEKNKERRKISSRASSKVQKAIKKGILIKPKECQICNKTNCRIEASHSDYSKPLDVLWVCVSCHRKYDYKNPKTVQITENKNLDCGYR